MRTWLITSLSAIAVAAVAAVLLLGVQPAHAEGSLAGVRMTVHKSPSCGCCGGCVDILREHGVVVTIVDTNDTAAVKTARGVPSFAWSCHTTDIGGYAVEGHVPIEALERLLAERPSIAGIALPGMPAGSPGMTGAKSAPFEVIAFGEGDIRVFGHF